MYRGFIKIHRELEDWALYKDSQAIHLLIHLLIRATHKPRKIKFQGKPYTLQAGQITTGRKVLSHETGISESKIRRLLKEFENFGEIEQKVTNKCTLITLMKWEQFQTDEFFRPTTEPTTDQQLTNNRPLNKNVKNVKNEKNILMYKTFEESFIQKWNQLCVEYPNISKVIKISDSRRKKLKLRYSDKSFKENTDSLMDQIKDSNFLLGKSDSKWIITFDWLIDNDKNYIKVLEGNYKNQGADKWSQYR